MVFLPRNAPTLTETMQYYCTGMHTPTERQEAEISDDSSDLDLGFANCMQIDLLCQICHFAYPQWSPSPAGLHNPSDFMCLHCTNCTWERLPLCLPSYVPCGDWTHRPDKTAPNGRPPRPPLVLEVWVHSYSRTHPDRRLSFGILDIKVETYSSYSLTIFIGSSLHYPLKKIQNLSRGNLRRGREYISTLRPFSLSVSSLLDHLSSAANGWMDHGSPFRRERERERSVYFRFPRRASPVHTWAGPSLASLH